MLKSHMDSIEEVLLAQAKVQVNTGHSLHKGTPREVFVRDYLVSHLPSNLTIGTGEIIDCNSKPGEKRNQFDIVIYKNNYPKLDFGGEISGFLIESVVATIEVKSTLREVDIENSILAAHKVKSLESSMILSYTSGHIPPKILNYIVAYDGPQKLSTTYDWIKTAHSNNRIIVPDLSADDFNQRISTPSCSIDGVFVLGKGTILFDNCPYTFFSEEMRKENPQIKWAFIERDNGNLLMLFGLLQIATSNLVAGWPDLTKYMSNFAVRPSFNKT